MSKGKKPGPQPGAGKTWMAIRTDYEVNGITNLAELARKYGVNRVSISKKKNAERWTSAHERQARILTDAAKNATEILTGEIGEQLAEDLRQHSSLANLLMAYAEQILQEGIAGTIEPGEKQNRADVFNSVVAGVGRAVGMSRDINGLRPGQKSTEGSTDERRRLEFYVPDEPQEQSEAS